MCCSQGSIVSAAICVRIALLLQDGYLAVSCATL